MFKIRSSTKIVVGFFAFSGIAWFGFNKIQDLMISGQTFSPIVPKRVNIVGVTPGGHYKIIVANEVAQLVSAPGGFQADQTDADDSSDSGGSVKKKISIKDMLGCLQGDPKAVSEFVTSMNELDQNNLPPVRVIWTKPDIEKALAGDPVMQKKLEEDLNVKLDGKPLPSLKISSIENGIVLQVPVPIEVNINGSLREVVGNVLVPYKPRMIKAVEAEVAADQGKIDNTTFAGYYKQEAEKTLKAKASDNIRSFLTEEFSDAQAKAYAQDPEAILKTAFVVVNDDFISDANYTTYTSPNGKPLYDLHITLNDEGRRRLWQYTRRRVGDQILLTSDGVGIAVARIHAPLMGGDVTITNMTDQGLLDDFVATVKNNKTAGGAK